jgi:predicted nucleic acid-binding protein
MAYVDTNVILARYFPEDELHNKAAAFFEADGNRKIASPVTVVELTAVVSRLRRETLAPKEILQEQPKKRIRAIVQFLLRDCGLSIAVVPARARIKLAGAVLTIPLEYQRSIQLAHALQLRTLDLIHIAYADNLRRWGHEVDTFVTGDSSILNAAEKIQEHVGIEVKEPQ